MTSEAKSIRRSTLYELGAIAVGTLLIGLFGHAFLGASKVWTLSYGRALCYAAVVLFGQHLIRDLLTLALKRLKTDAHEQSSAQPQRCLCAESTLGLVIVLAGTLVLLSGLEGQMKLGAPALSGAFLGINLLGLVVKDYVVAWENGFFRVRRVENHGEILVG